MFFERMITGLYSHRQWLATGVFAALTAGFCYHVVFGANGMLAYRQKVAEYHQLQQQIQQAQVENEKLQERIKQLKSDPQAIEREAREKFRYARPGELIYLLPAPEPPNPPSKAMAQKH